MARIIIDYPDDMTTFNALEFALSVVRQGRISQSGDIPHFCWCSTFNSPREGEQIMVCCRRKKKGQSSDSLAIYRTQDKRRL